VVRFGSAWVQVYRYAFQPGEKREWNNLSWVITPPIFICAVAIFALWYNNRAISYVHIVSVMGLVFVVLGVGGAVWIGRKRAFSRRFIFLLALAAGLVSLIVPIGAVGLILTWPFVIVGVVGYLYIRYENEHVLGQDYAALTRWQIDSITLAAMATLPLCFLIVLWIACTASPIVSDWLSLIFAFPTLLVLLFSWIMSEGIRFHLRSFSGKKKPGNTNPAPQGFFWYWMGMLFIWGFLSVGMVLLGLFWQGISYFLLAELVRH